MSFVRGNNPIWFFSNLTGQPFDDTYYAFFLTNDLPYVPQSVYQDPNGTIPWSNPIEFQPSSGIPNNIYFDPSLNYRIEFRQGSTQSDPLIYLVQNYTVGNASSELTDDPLITSENMIMVPNFSDVFFTSPFVITTSGTYEIAPQWNLEVNGVGGTTTVTQIPNAADSNVFGNPSYFLKFESTGWTSVRLYQFLGHNGGIFSGGAIAVAFTAYSTTSPNVLTVSYQPSVGVGTIIFTGSIPAGSPDHYEMAVDIPLSTNNALPPNANIAIQFSLPASGTISLSNIQITGQSTPLSQGFKDDPNPPVYQELSYQKIVNSGEFFEYKESLISEPKKTMLTGWNFGLNPWQFRTTSQSNLANNEYTADQTIVVQQAYVTGAVSNNVSVGRGTDSENYGFLVKAVTANNQFALIQYIDSSTIKPYWGRNLSSMVKARIRTTNNTLCKFKMKLIYRTSLPSTISQNEPISSWTALGEPVFSSGWTSISSLNDPAYTLIDENINKLDFSFNQFRLPNSSSENMILGIVVYTITNLSIIGTTDYIIFDRISLTNTTHAIDGTTETYDESLRKCQFYYEKSYIPSDLPGTVTKVNMNSNYSKTVLTGGQSRIFPTWFELKYKQTKRYPSTVTYYSAQNGTINTLDIVFINGLQATPTGTVFNIPSTDFSSLFPTSLDQTSSIDRIQNYPTNTNLITSVAGGVEEDQTVIFYHYTADSRLGI